MVRAAFAFLGLGLTLAQVACTSDGGGNGGEAAPPAAAASSIACDPLAPTPITLGAIVGVGTDESGTTYVDAANGVFVATGEELDRQHVSGTGEAGTTEYLFTFEPPGDPASARTLLVETDGAGSATAMALAPAGTRQFLDQPSAVDTPLTLVDGASIAALPVVNTPHQISYVADVANGDLLLATVPMDRDATSDPDDIASTSGGLAIFYGAREDVEQRKITAFEQTRGGQGTVTFLVGSDSYVLAFGTVTRGDSPLGDFTLLGLTRSDGTTLAVTLRSPTPVTLPAEAAFSCRP